jgi:hypothetical protein
VNRAASGLLLACALAGLASAGVAAGPDAQDARKRITVLATGDSMIQVVDIYVKRRLNRGRVRVRSDAHISTGLSKSGGLNWPRYSKRQARRFKPRATVVFIGANDGFPMSVGRARVNCCGGAWRNEYARRARRMMRAYRRHGAGRVYWLLLPQARGGFFARSYPAVNAALRRADRKRDGVRLVHLNKVFTPGGHYRSHMRWHGRVVRVRQSDGVHLSAAGADIAAGIVARKVRKDLRRKKRKRRRRR